MRKFRAGRIGGFGNCPGRNSVVYFGVSDMKRDAAQLKKGSVENNSEAPSRSAQRRQREREKRLQTILDAAAELFAGEGYHKASMEMIADLAEVSVGTVYFYFKNKEDLLIRLIDEIGHQLRNLLAAAFRKEDPSVEGIRRAGIAFFEDFCPNNPERTIIFFRESPGQSPLVESHRKKIFNKVISDVQEALTRIGKQQGAPYQSPVSAEVMAVSIMGMFERIAYHYLIWQDRSEELKMVGADAVTFILGGIDHLCRK
jgi:AcrR family transcriptional regulator